MKNPENLESEKIFGQTKTLGCAFYVKLTGSGRIFDDFASALRKPVHTFFFILKFSKPTKSLVITGHGSQNNENPKEKSKILVSHNVEV